MCYNENMESIKLRGKPPLPRGTARNNCLGVAVSDNVMQRLEMRALYTKVTVSRIASGLIECGLEELDAKFPIVIENNS